MLLRFMEIEEPAHYSEKFDAQELEMGYNYSAKVMPLTLEMDASPLQKGCLLEGSFSYEASLPCARCLEPVPVSGHSHFSVEVKPRSALNLPEGGEESFVARTNTMQERAKHVRDCKIVSLPGNHHLHLEAESYEAVGSAIQAFLAG